MTALIFILVSLFLVVGMPVAFALGVVGLSGLFALEGGGAFYGVTMIIYESLYSFTLTAIPLFILMANILIHSRISEDLYRFIHSLVGHWPGGLGIATVLFCAGFSAISGSSVATAATVGMLSVPEMLQMGYDRRFTFGLVAAGGTLGILIPPSLSMILYGALTDVSVGDLFIAGIIPGLILTGFFLVYTFSMPAMGAMSGPGRRAGGREPVRCGVPPGVWSCRRWCWAASTWAGSRPPKRPESASSTA